jgi:hypothetical protein
MAGRRLRSYRTKRVQLSEALKALIGDQQVVLYDRARGSFFFTLREAQAMATALARIGDEAVDVSAREYDTHEVELSPSLRALIGGSQVILWDRGRGGTVITHREAQILSTFVGTTDKVNLDKTGSN